MENIDELSLVKERGRLYKRIKEINSILDNLKNTKLDIETVAERVKQFTGINVYKIGKKCKKESKIAKQIFWRCCFECGISGTISSNYTGDSSRYAAITGRSYHIKKCKKHKHILLQWLDFKKFIKKTR